MRTSWARVMPARCFLTACSVLSATRLMMLFILQLTWHCFSAFRSLTRITYRIIRIVDVGERDSSVILDIFFVCKP